MVHLVLTRLASWSNEFRRDTDTEREGERGNDRAERQIHLREKDIRRCCRDLQRDAGRCHGCKGLKRE